MNNAHANGWSFPITARQSRFYDRWHMQRFATPIEIDEEALLEDDLIQPLRSHELETPPLHWGRDSGSGARDRSLSRPSLERGSTGNIPSNVGSDPSSSRPQTPPTPTPTRDRSGGSRREILKGKQPTDKADLQEEEFSKRIAQMALGGRSAESQRSSPTPSSRVGASVSRPNPLPRFGSFKDSVRELQQKVSATKQEVSSSPTDSSLNTYGFRELSNLPGPAPAEMRKHEEELHRRIATLPKPSPKDFFDTSLKADSDLQLTAARYCADFSSRNQEYRAPIDEVNAAGKPFDTDAPDAEAVRSGVLKDVSGNPVGNYSTVSDTSSTAPMVSFRFPTRSGKLWQPDDTRTPLPATVSGVNSSSTSSARTRISRFFTKFQPTSPLGGALTPGSSARNRNGSGPTSSQPSNSSALSKSGPFVHPSTPVPAVASGQSNAAAGSSIFPKAASALKGGPSAPPAASPVPGTQSSGLTRTRFVPRGETVPQSDVAPAVSTTQGTTSTSTHNFTNGPFFPPYSAAPTVSSVQGNVVARTVARGDSGPAPHPPSRVPGFFRSRPFVPQSSPVPGVSNAQSKASAPAHTFSRGETTLQVDTTSAALSAQNNPAIRWYECNLEGNFGPTSQTPASVTTFTSAPPALPLDTLSAAASTQGNTSANSRAPIQNRGPGVAAMNSFASLLLRDEHARHNARDMSLAFGSMQTPDCSIDPVLDANSRVHIGFHDLPPLGLPPLAPSWDRPLYQMPPRAIPWNALPRPPAEEMVASGVKNPWGPDYKYLTGIVWDAAIGCSRFETDRERIVRWEKKSLENQHTATDDARASH